MVRTVDCAKKVVDWTPFDSLTGTCGAVSFVLEHGK